MAKRNRADYMFQNKEGEVLIKKPGTIAGNGFSIDKVQNCKVYVLDHTTQVQIDFCTNCTIFIGPCDGSVFLRDCIDCLVIAAARQIRTRDCKNLELSVYCPTQPSIETSSGLKFSCWRGAYPGLRKHFEDAKLDPTNNTWDQIFNFNAKDDDAASHYSVDYTAYPFFEVPVEGLGPCENPVPNSDGSFYVPGDEPQIRGEFEAEIVDTRDTNGSAAASSQPVAALAAEPEWDQAPEPEQQYNPQPDQDYAQAAERDDARAAWAASNNALLQSKAAQEAAAKGEQLTAAAAHRAKVAEARATATAARLASNRESEEAGKQALAAPAGETVWHRVMAMLDPTARVPQSDCSRFKALLITCRDANKQLTSN